MGLDGEIVTKIALRGPPDLARAPRPFPAVPPMR